MPSCPSSWAKATRTLGRREQFAAQQKSTCHVAKRSWVWKPLGAGLYTAGCWTFCSTAVEQMPHYREVMGLNQARSWAFSLLYLTISAPLIRSLTDMQHCSLSVYVNTKISMGGHGPLVQLTFCQVLRRCQSVVLLRSGAWRSSRSTSWSSRPASEEFGCRWILAWKRDHQN